jgi:copper chaperone NosL
MKQIQRLLSYLITALLFGVLCVGCSAPQPVPIRYGEDTCAYCRMTIVEHNFGAELVTDKGKVFSFDSIECLAAFTVKDNIPQSEIHSLWVTDFQVEDSLLNANGVFFVHSANMNSPMGMGLFAFSSRDDALSFSRKNDGEILTWPQLKELVSRKWFE